MDWRCLFVWLWLYIYIYFQDDEELVDLYKDLSDGVVLLRIAEQLTGASLVS